MGTEAEIAWAAGLFEGEGCVSVQRPKHAPNVVQVRLQVTSTDRDVLEKFADAIGCGRLYGPYDRDPSRKPVGYWFASSRADVDRAAEAMRPWLCSRRIAALDAALEARSEPRRHQVGLRPV